MTRVLYPDEDVRNTVWSILSEDFEDSFERLLKELKALRSLLVNPAKANKEKIKEQFIEYGHKMVTVMDLKDILDIVNNTEAESDLDSEWK